MLLDRIDIDARRTLNGVELGPFSEHLNVVTSPEGSGKTAIVRFIRDSLVNRNYPLGMMSSSTGRVVWADRHGMLHCRREKDGTALGRRTVQFESRGATLADQMENAYKFGDRNGSTGMHRASWASSHIDPSYSDSALAMKSIQLPHSLVDGVVTDSSLTSVARVVRSCIQSGLDSPDAYRSLPPGRDSVYSVYQDRDAPSENHRNLREQLATIDAELGRYDTADRHQAPIDHEEPGRLRELNRLHDTARGLRHRQAELRRWIAEMDNEAARHGGRASSIEIVPAIITTNRSPMNRCAVH